MLSSRVRYESFVECNGNRIRAALVAAYGADVGADAAAEALAYGFEHWTELEAMSGMPHFEPALEALTEAQRSIVIMVHALGWTLTDTAEMLGLDVSTVRTHIARAMKKLRKALEVTLDGT